MIWSKVKNPITELRSTKLYTHLKQQNPTSAKKIELFVKSIVPTLSTIKDIFPLYTRHDANHSYRVCTRIEQILKKDCFNKKSSLNLSDTELFLLLAR